MSKMKCAVISDGYTFDGDVAGGETYPALNFKFRPLTHIERATLMQEENDCKEDEVKIARLRAKIISTHIVSWDAKAMNEEGTIVDCEIDATNTLNLNTTIFGTTYCVVGGIMERTEKLRKKQIDDVKKKLEGDAKPDSELETEEKN